MKTLERKQRRCVVSLSLFGIIGGLTLFISLPVPAQVLTYSALKTQIAQIAQQIKAVQTQQDQLFRPSHALNDKINTTKQELQKGGNLILELQLQNNLKASREIANQMQALDKKAYDLTEQSVVLKKQVVTVLSAEIEHLSQEAAATRDAKQRFQRFQRVLQLQKEKETYQAQITEESNELLLALDVTIAKEDGPDDLLQKSAIIKDQRDIIRDKERKLERQIQDTQKELNLRQNMLELLRDIGRSEEDEFDLSRNLRIAELQEAIADMEAALEIMRAKKEIWRAKEQALTKKAERFSQEAARLMQPFPKGESSEK